MRLLLLFSLIMIMASACKVNPEKAADVIFMNGQILTMEGNTPSYVEAVAVKDGKIVFTGKAKGIKKWKGDVTKLVDLNDRTLMPGFVDSHSHLATIVSLWRSVNLAPFPAGKIRSLEEILQKLKAEAVKHPGRFIFATGYDETSFSSGDKRHPTRDELDAISSDVPIVLLHRTLHMGVANSKALEMAGISDRNVTNPVGGKFLKDEKGHLNGIFEERAVFSILPILPMPSPEEAISDLKEALNYYMANGITTAQEGYAMPESYQLLKMADEAGLLPIDVVAYLKWTNFEQMNRSNDLQLGKYQNRFKVGGVKIVLDGSPQIKTAYVTTPFHICPAEGRSCMGYAQIDYEEFSGYIRKFHENNIQTIVHCNGDSAAGMMIRAMKEAEQNKGKRDLRFTMIHAQMVRSDQLDEMKKLGIFPSFFPSHTYYWGDWHRTNVMGEERAARISPLKSAQDKGLLFGIHTDAPIIPVSQLDAIQRAVSRTTRSGYVLGAPERIDVYTALKASTIWGAYMYREENRKGSIKEGKLADLIVLDKNPLSVQPDEIGKIKVMETFKEGVSVFKLKMTE
jgi:predicted amidohydrolase YtcJ